MNANERKIDGQEHGRPVFRILLPLDGSELAARALPVAMRLCSRLSGELELVRALPNIILPYATSEAYVPAEIYQQLADERLREAQDYLQRVTDEAATQGVHANAHIVWGDAAAAVLDLAAALPADLIVMTTHGRTGLARFALGSVADRVVRGGEAPVLLIRSFADAKNVPASAAVELRHALVPLDGSPLAASVLYSIALRLAGPVLHEITLLRVADPRDGLTGVATAEEYLEAERARLLERLGGRHCDVSRQVKASRNPAQVIVGCAQEQACDLVLMSTHGEAGLGRLAFGGNTDRVLRDGAKPLLLVHPPREARQ